MTASRRSIATALVAVVLLAGCSAGTNGGPSPGTSASPIPDGSTGSGTLSFYLSDQPSAIGEFDRLTVTVTEIGIHRGGVDVGGNETSQSTLNATPGGNASTAENGTEAAETSTADAGWITVAVANRTVDLTELEGANATRVADARLDTGEYNGVYVQVSNVTGVLTTGETVGVQLPSQRLRLNKGFAVGANRTTDFVFDIAVHRAGGSGKYVLRPVIGQSGTDVPIRSVDRTRNRTHSADAGPPSDRRNQDGEPPGQSHTPRGGPPTAG